MANLTVTGAVIKCSGAVSPGTSTLSVSLGPTSANGTAATILDKNAMMNIPSFGMCNKSSNPAVAAATSANKGVHTPSACIPVISSPWTSGSSAVTINNMPALSDDSTCQCSYGGCISIESPGQMNVTL